MGTEDLAQRLELTHYLPRNVVDTDAPPERRRLQCRRTGGLAGQRDGLPVRLASRQAGAILYLAGMLNVLREGPGWAVVNKPAGIATERHFQYATVESLAADMWARPKASKPPYVGIVHRLDRVTSGALLLARRKSTLVRLNAAFANGSVKKVYLAATDAPLPDSAGRLRHFLGRDPANRLAVASTRPVAGAKEAILDYKLLDATGTGYLYEVSLLTGRYHQIRAQFAAVCAPIIGDAPYGSQRVLGAHQIALHAVRLTFPDPADDALVTVTAPLPAGWPLAPVDAYQTEEE